jgi:hypothetical protein
MTNESNPHEIVPDVLETRSEEEQEPDIQELLDIGYNQLDGFVIWLEEHLGQDIRSAQQDCFNAESMIDYLANHPHKEAASINEFDLRWFLFSHYIRKIKADSVIEDRLLVSLQRFFLYLQAEHAASMPQWMHSILEDQDYYQQRRETYIELNDVDAREWKEGFRTWCTELEEDLDLRCLWLPTALGNGLAWNERMGWREATLREEANKIWQKEREELLMDGLDYDSVRERLGESYLLWLDTPQDRLEGLTPKETILEERSSLAEDLEEEED